MIRTIRFSPSCRKEVTICSRTFRSLVQMRRVNMNLFPRRIQSSDGGVKPGMAGCRVAVSRGWNWDHPDILGLLLSQQAFYASRVSFLALSFSTHPFSSTFLLRDSAAIIFLPSYAYVIHRPAAAVIGALACASNATTYLLFLHHAGLVAEKKRNWLPASKWFISASP